MYVPTPSPRIPPLVPRRLCCMLTELLDKEDAAADTRCALLTLDSDSFAVLRAMIRLFSLIVEWVVYREYSIISDGGSKYTSACEPKTEIISDCLIHSSSQFVKLKQPIIGHSLYNFPHGSAITGYSTYWHSSNITNIHDCWLVRVECTDFGLNSTSHQHYIVNDNQGNNSLLLSVTLIRTTSCL